MLKEIIIVNESEEILEIVDEDGNPIGTATRGECHSDKNLAHRAVHVLVLNSRGDVFLQKRSRNKKIQPGKWDSSAGGHTCPGEDWETAARRELEEELGLEVAQLELLKDYVWRSDVETEVVRAYTARSEGPFKLHPDEIDEGRFWSPEELREAAEKGILTPNLEFELKNLGISLS